MAFGASNIALTKAGLLKHDVPVHGKISGSKTEICKTKKETLSKESSGHKNGL